MTIFQVGVPGTASAARVLAALRAEFTAESSSITVHELGGEFEVLLRKIDSLTKELLKKDDDHANMIKSMEEAHKQMKELMTETSHLRHKYEKQKTALIAALWQHCAPFHPELSQIPVIPEEKVVETMDGVDRYMFKKVLGEGQFASVRVCHLADGLSSPSALAIKIINKDRIASFSSMRRVSNEIEALKVLKSKHTLAIHDVIQTSAHLYLVMDRGGVDLFCFFDAFPNGTSEKIGKDISLRILSAVAHCHKHKFCHLDLKPENILVEFDSNSSKIINLKLCDFGMCSKFEEETLKYDFCGSPGFFAPEMLIRRKYYGDKADVWSVGCIMLELFVGHQIFSDKWMQAYHHDGLKDSSKFEKVITAAVKQLPSILPLSIEMVHMIMTVFQMDPVIRPSVLILLEHACFDDVSSLRSELKSLDLSDGSCMQPTLDSREKLKTKELVENWYGSIL
jgi:serine/threonine protein kinase